MVNVSVLLFASVTVSVVSDGVRVALDVCPVIVFVPLNAVNPLLVALVPKPENLSCCIVAKLLSLSYSTTLSTAPVESCVFVHLLQMFQMSVNLLQHVVCRAVVPLATLEVPKLLGQRPDQPV